MKHLVSDFRLSYPSQDFVTVAFGSRTVCTVPVRDRSLFPLCRAGIARNLQAWFPTCSWETLIAVAARAEAGVS